MSTIHRVSSGDYPRCMCGRFVTHTSNDEIGEIFETTVTGDALPVPSWNIAPTQTIALVIESARSDAEIVRRLEPARWSLVPSWSKRLTTKFPTFNARSENLADKAMWREPLKSHRAIVPADGYYEWHTDPATGTRTPYYIHVPGEMIAMAGLYSWWRDPSKTNDDDDRWLLTATILTSSAVDTLVGIHDRNPVPIPPSFWGIWLDRSVEGDQSLVDAAVAASLPVAEAFEVYPVAPITTGDEGDHLIERVD